MTVFTIAEQKFGWAEIVSAAQAWGEWQSFVTQTRHALACLKYAAVANQLPASKEVHEAATAFRYARRLISAEETQNWLRAREMTVESWLNCLRGQLLRERWAYQFAQLAAAQPVSDAEVEQVIKHYAVCAGQLELWAQKLAGRAAVAAKSGALAVGDQSPHYLIAHIENEFSKQSQQAVTPQRLAAKIADHRLDWIRFACRYVWFPEERLAREAALCVKEDGLTLEEVAADARSIVQQWDFYLDELDAAARPQFLAARQGDWLGPVKLLEGFPLFAIVSKQMPVADDPPIAQRAAQALVSNLIEKESNERVQWLM